MAKRSRLSSITVNAQADVLAMLLDGGYIDIFDGEQPETADASPATNNNRCVSLRFGSPAFLKSENGQVAANPISSAIATRTVQNATWARCYRPDHKTAVMDISVGTRDANLILPTTHIVAGVTVSCSGFVHTVAKATLGA